MTGFDFYNSNSGGTLDGTALRGRCSTVNVSGGVATLTFSGVTAWGGPASGTLYTGNCPANQAVVGVDAQTTSHPVMGWFRLYCASVSFNGGTNQLEIAAAPASPSTGLIGPNHPYAGGTYYDRVVAPAGQALAGFDGRSGAALDLVSFKAYSFVQGSLTLNAIVNPGGSAVPGDFTLIATDSGSVAVNFSSGDTRAMTPSSYTLSWNGPAGYTLSNLSCATTFTLNNGDNVTCTYTFDPPPSISGFVFNDNGAGGGTVSNGIKDGSEAGVGVAVPVVAYNAATGQCYATTADPTTGAYTISPPVTGTYQVYEAVNETNIASPTCPPMQPTLNTATGAYSGGTIGDPTNFHSSTANVASVTAGVASNVNFGDFAITPFDTCSSEAYLLRNSPTDITGVSLATGAITPLFNDVLPSSTGVFGGTGYNVITNTLFGDNTNNNNTVLMVDGGGNAFVLPITGSTMTLSNYNSGDIDDDGNLLLMTSSGTSLYKIDVNPNSATYLQQVQQLTVSAPVMADMAINPIDNMLYTLTPSGSLVRFDPTNGTRTNLGSVGAAGTTAVGWGAVYFDDQGFMYASQNPNPGRIIRIDISNPTLPSGSYVAVNFTQMNASTSQNDGARCRFANLPLDFADAPTTNGYATELADNGPRHLIESNLPYLGANEPDSENDAQPNAAANGDDTNGLTPDDEDGFIQPSITTILAGGDNVTLSVPVVTSGNDNLYGWIDFDLSGTFDNDEIATVAVTATGNSTLNFTVPADVQLQDTFVRLRICSNGETCNSPTGSAGDGEVEDHPISLMPPGDLELDLELEPGVNVTLGIPFNVVVKVENKGTTIALNTKVTLPIPAGYSFVRAYEGDGVTPTTIYDPATGELDLGAVGLGFNDYAVIRLAPQSATAPPISGEIIETSISDTDSTPNNGFNNGEDDTDTVTPNITNVIQPNTCDSPVVYEGGDA
ncbi:GEVED domain-containing protein, partial [Photobacterium leiognathi]|uniref:GEVED domain-containing protein n=1 Tax=Photobacterium leiognathi TaxID=553611 RepID=UPI002158CC8F